MKISQLPRCCRSSHTRPRLTDVDIWCACVEDHIRLHCPCHSLARLTARHQTKQASKPDQTGFARQALPTHLQYLPKGESTRDGWSVTYPTTNLSTRHPQALSAMDRQPYNPTLVRSWRSVPQTTPGSQPRGKVNVEQGKDPEKSNSDSNLQISLDSGQVQSNSTNTHAVRERVPVQSSLTKHTHLPLLKRPKKACPS